MRRLAASLFVAGGVCASNAFGQSPVLIKYCQDMTASYRKAIADGKEPIGGVGQAIADCPTNPNASIPVLEAALKKYGVPLPPK